MRGLDDTQRRKVIAEARTWAGTKHHHQGRIKGAGVDCAMFLLEVFERCGLIPHSVPPDYPPDWNLHRSEERYLFFVNLYAARVGIAQPADVVAFKIGRCVSHAAIVIEWPLVIHSCRENGVILDNVLANAWYAERIAGFYAFDHDKADPLLAQCTALSTATANAAA